MISAEAPILFARACEIFIEEVGITGSTKSGTAKKNVGVDGVTL